jgi:formylglycine-generating enzyme required for sulfatase activity
VANDHDDSVSIFLNDGSGDLANVGTYVAGDGANFVGTEDLDGDGDDDLVIANRHSDDLTIMLNGGDAVFALHQTVSVGIEPRRAILADFDLDGDIDVATANVGSNAVSVLLNDGTASFAHEGLYAVGSGPYDLASSDIDGDGDVDIVTADYYGNTITTLINRTSRFAMSYIPGGEFEMGDHHGVGDPDERPVHDVYLDPYFMSVYETTNTQFAMFLNSAFAMGQIDVIGGVVYKSGDDDPYCETTASSDYSRIAWDGDTFTVVTDKAAHPMVMVSWYGSVAYANWLSSQDGLEPAYDLETWTCDFEADGYRLPTEAEWEFAARGGEHDPYYLYAWGDTVDGSRANYRNSGDPLEGDEPETTPVGLYEPNAYGLCDMNGNVWERCNDWFSASYYQTSPEQNPQGPPSGSQRVLRGGSWHDDLFYARNANRNASPPQLWAGHHGFRVVRPASLPDGALYVDDDAAPGGDGLTWGSAFRHLQDALDAARAGDTIRVAQGIYRPDESADHPDGTGDREATFIVRSDTLLEGGYAGLGGGDPDLRDPRTFVTILDGDLNDDDLPGFINATDNARHVVTADYDVNGALIDGFTIRRGYSDEDTPDPTIAGGAGLLCEATQLTVRNCRFEWNHSGRAGGALYTRHGNLDVEHCTFQYNEGGFGAAVNSFSGTVAVISSMLCDNATDWHGGAIANEADLTLVNCMLTRNIGGLGSGAISTAGNLTLLDCTLTQNTGPQAGGIRAVWWTESVTLRNSILWGNVDNTGQDEVAQFDASGGDVDIDYCCIQGWTGGYGGTGNIGDDPAFRDALGPDGVWGSGDEDHHPASGSPCIDAGGNDLVPAFLALDLDGQPRFTDDVNTPDTGQGDPPIVDMGAYEWQHSPCWDADLNNDRVVDLRDLGILLAYYDWGDGGDIDGDGDTDLSDLGILLAHYDEICN